GLAFCEAAFSRAGSIRQQRQIAESGRAFYMGNTGVPKNSDSKREAEDAPAIAPRSDAGLCESCSHSKQVKSARGSIFWLCQLSVSDPTFPKYPRLPVLACRGYQAEHAPKSRN
ncbi:MAG TPA: hypothetical protein VJP87_04535, partial [Candidatus Acidoferrales bacterium]|nr:hypothetical protein [Candidatus Acidoferrales bacterium]